MTTRRTFLKRSALAAGGTALLGSHLVCGTGGNHGSKSRVISVAAEDMLISEKYNPDAIAENYWKLYVQKKEGFEVEIVY